VVFRASVAARQAQPALLGCKSSRSGGAHRDSVASTSPISSLQAKPEAENPEFPCAWKQLLKFLVPQTRRGGSRRAPAVAPGNRQPWGSWLIRWQDLPPFAWMAGTTG
jgi:hypothetical protein